MADLLYIFNHASCKAIFLENVKAFDKIQNSLTKLKDLKYIIFFNDPGKIKVPTKIKLITLEELMNKGLEHLNAKLYKRYRVVEKIVS